MQRTARWRPTAYLARFVSVAALVGLALCLAAPTATGQDASAATRPPAVMVTSETARPAEQARHRVVSVPEGPPPAAIVSREADRPAAMVNRLYNAGRAAGLAGVIYDNRDGDHSRLSVAEFPQLRETRYGAPFTETGQDRGLAGPVSFDAPVIGNASLAVTRGPFARSLPRLAMQDQRSARRAYELFAANHLYVYPEHRDHDPETGDRFAAQMPYFVITQGSSGSDRPFLRALALTYAAFPPETFARLREAGLLPATAQMILRRTAKGITSDAAYLSPRAHPTAFDADTLRPAAMVALAAAMQADEAPPMVHLEVTRDLSAVPGRDYLARNLSERLFTTPSAVARVWRSFAGQRRMELSAARSTDPNGKPLSFSWVLLRGDPAKVTITPEGPGGVRAEIVMDWHAPGEITGPGGIAASRIEIAVFAHNGHHHSAPAFVSVAVPLHQARDYAGRGAGAQLWSLNYDPGERYVDPLIWPVANWDDRLAHGPDGQVEAMTRRRRGQRLPYALHREPSGGWLRRIEGASSVPSIITHRAEGPPGAGFRLVEIPAE